ncbi:MAG: hypothetical protein K8R37_09020 [Bacteroidales bacterium]|nr:hypothetical protein [Bacteroidales bacterium]
MHTIRLRVNDKIYANIMWFLGRFNKSEIELITENNEYLSIQSYLKEELNEVKEGKAKYYSIEEVEHSLEEVIEKYEDKD